ncbi:MAG: hypothetical protein KGL39_26565 [Patescibacteria group bacterium]|nr:hypothetical protein [Patescibacteria group bacterium]
MPVAARHLIAGLLFYVDQQGRENANPATLRELFFEFDESVDASEVESLLLLLAENGWLHLYSSGKRQLMQVQAEPWRSFVTIDGRNKSVFPPPSVGPETFLGHSRSDSGPPLAGGRGEAGGGWPGETGGETPDLYDRWLTDPELPPPPGCRRHPNNLAVGNCGACAGSRKVHDAYMRGEITRDEAIAAHRSPVRSDPVDDE